jgi:hypothetical protein
MYEIKSSYQCCIICAATVNTGHIVKPPVWDEHCCHSLYTDTRSFCSLNLELGLPSIIYFLRLGKYFSNKIQLLSSFEEESDIWSQVSYRYAILWEAFLDPSNSYFLFADFVDFYTHWTYILYMPISSRIFLSNYWWQKSDIWSQASNRYPISWEAFFDPSDSKN